MLKLYDAMLKFSVCVCVSQLPPPRSPAAPDTSSTSAKTDAASQRGGSVTERTTVGTGLMKLSAQVRSLCWCQKPNF